LITTGNFEDIYIATREKEQRLYTDEQVASLPCIEPTHIHYKEWEIRKRSSTRLFNRLQQKKKPLTILEIGCGNGWLSAKLAGIKDAEVTGIDINKTELEQARRVFGNKWNIDFLLEDTWDMNMDDAGFDVIVFAASIQYFQSFESIIQAAMLLLNKNGEIHILDSHFYRNSELDEAANRSLHYYTTLGFNEMANQYFHHPFSSLKKFNHKILFDPASIKNKLFNKADPFPWICITI